ASVPGSPARRRNPAGNLQRVLYNNAGGNAAGRASARAGKQRDGQHEEKAEERADAYAGVFLRFCSDVGTENGKDGEANGPMVGCHGAPSVPRGVVMFP